MTRSFSNTLLFESALDSVTSSSSNSLLYNVIQTVLNPTLTIIEDKCDTLLGLNMPVSFRATGCYELIPDAVISNSRVTALITSGASSTAIRSVSTCISVGGVCRTCYMASRPNAAYPSVGSTVRYSSELILDIVPLMAPASVDTLILTYDSSQFDKLYIFDSSTVLIPGTDYTVSGNTLTLLGSYLPARTLVIKYVVYSLMPYYSWISKTYSGSLLGVKPLYDQILPVRKELLEMNISQEDINVLMYQLRTSGVGGEDSVLYLSYITDPVEQAIFTMLLSSIYLN